MISLLAGILLLGVHAQEEFTWNRWEQRTVDCISSGAKDECILQAPRATLPKDPKEYKCRREPMPQHAWNQLARNSTTRLACPIGCEPDFDLSVSRKVITKVPFDNDKCQKYYTYGKYRDQKENEW
ncbi:unnamed protein product [Strongylus vulgaris]|uniref:Uncharacterized protein n=1 Tax=Strongylus vulgaris TaxID=40348 RepID=A0A3P7IJM3_STRVU|nr:unnamed protein product [Strongylus vulgaris]